MEEFSHLDKIFYPKDGITKKDVIDYYEAVAKVILPHLKNRPLVLHRMPDGIHGKNFYQKNVTNPPNSVPTVKVVHSRSEISYLYIENTSHLKAIVNFGCIEIHAFTARIHQLNKPDYLVIDLDPESANFSDVITTAKEFRKLFNALKIKSYCKTSGMRGLHIYLPLEARYTFAQARTFAELLCRFVHKKIPKITSLIRSPKKRQGKVYLDYLQNRSKQSMNVVYSLRARDGAFVSTPLKWEEINQKLTPDIGNIKNIIRRIEKDGDLFSPVLERGIDIEALISKPAWESYGLNPKIPAGPKC